MARKKKSSLASDAPPAPVVQAAIAQGVPLFADPDEARRVMRRIKRLPLPSKQPGKKSPFYKEGDFTFPQDRPPLRSDSLIKGDRPEPLRSEGVAYLCNCGRAAREGAACVCEVDPRVLRREVGKANAQRERRQRSIQRQLKGSKLSPEMRAALESELAEIEQFYVTARNRTEANLVAEGRVAGKRAGPRQRRITGKMEAKTVAPGVIRRTRVDGLGAVGDKGIISIWSLGSLVLIGVGAYAIYSTFQKPPKG